MTVELTIQAMFDNYPILFKERADCLDQLFIVVGNGYKWEKGELVSREYSYNTNQLRELQARLVDGKAFQHNLMSLKAEAIYYDQLRQAEGKRDLLEDLYPKDKAKQIRESRIASLPDNVYHKYPRKERWYCAQKDPTGKLSIILSKSFAKLFNYPNDIKSDWLAAIEETKQLLIEDFGEDIVNQL